MHNALLSSNDQPWNGSNKYKPETKAQKYARRSTLAVTTGTVVIEPLFSVFLGQTAYAAILNIVQLVRENPHYVFNDTEKALVAAACVVLATANLIGDVGSVDPANDAQSFVDIFFGAAKKASSTSLATKIATGTFTLGFIATSYWIGAAADSVPVAQLIDQVIGKGLLAQIANYTSLGIVGFLGTVYYVMFGTNNLISHLKNIGEITIHPLQFLSRIVRHLPQYLEVLLQGFSNIAYRSLSFGAIISEVLAQTLKITDPNIKHKLFFITIIGTAITALLTRTKQIADGLVSEKNDVLTYKEWFHGLGDSLKTATGLGNFAMTAILSAIRGGASGVLGFALLNEIYRPAVIVGSFALGFHRLAIGLSEQANRAALAALPADELTRRMNLETNPSLIIGDEDSDDKAERLFQEMKATYHEGIVNSLVFADNAAARICRLLGFVGFIYMCAHIANISLPLDVGMALSLLWGSGVFSADLVGYQKNMMDFFSAFMVRVFIEKYATEHQQIQATHPRAVLANYDSIISAADVPDDNKNIASHAAQHGFWKTAKTTTAAVGRAYFTADSRYEPELVIEAAAAFNGSNQSYRSPA